MRSRIDPRTRGGGRAVALLFVAALPAGAVEAQIGVSGGYSRDSFGGFQSPAFDFADRVDGFTAGIFLDFRIARVGLRPAIVYRQLQEAIREPDLPPSNLEVVEIPLDIRVSAPLPVADPYLVAGPTLMFPSSARPPVDEALAGARLRVGIGAGVEWDVGFRLWPEIRYEKSLGGIVEDDTTGDSELDTFIIRLGISF